MKLTIAQPALADLLARGGAVAKKNSPSEILNHVRLIADRGVLQVSSTDLDRYAESQGPADVERPGETTVSAAALAALVSRHPRDGVISLELEGHILTVKCGRSRVKMSTIPTAAWPAWVVDEPDFSFDLAQSDFVSAFGRARIAVGDPGGAFVLQGAYLHEYDGALRLVSTNTYHMAIVDLGMPEGAAGLCPVIIPAEFIDIALRLIKGQETVSVGVSANQVFVETAGARLASKTIEGPYIDYARGVPARGRPAMALSRRALAECLARAALTTQEGQWSGVVATPREGALELKTRTSKGDETTEEIEAEIPEGMRPFAFSPLWMVNLIGAFTGDEMTIEYGGESRDQRVLVYSEKEPEFFGLFGTLAANLSMAA